jgi:hypothetical protein
MSLIQWRKKMLKQQKIMNTKETTRGFNPFRLVSDEEYGANLNAIISYYQIAKGESKRRLQSTKV